MRRRTTVAAAAVAVVVAAGTVAGLGAAGSLPDVAGLPGHDGAAASPSPSASAPRPTRRAAPPVLAAATEPPAPGGPRLAGAGAVRRLLRADALGSRPGAVVLDAETGWTFVSQAAGRPRTPASLAKLATAAAVLTTLDPQHRLTTSVVRGRTPGEVVLVGGGDASLTSRRPRPGDYPRRASLADLATATAGALAASPGPVRVRVDDSLFSGPAVSPTWPASYVASGVVSPVSALSVDGGRVKPGTEARSADPALAAGRELAQRLRRLGVDVRGEVTRTTAPPAAATLAQVQSPTVAELVQADLAASDNDLAEALARVAAVGAGHPGSFAGATATVADVLARLGVPTPGLAMHDASGLSREDRIAPVTLARLLAVASGDAHPQLRPLVTGLPVAGFTGTLSDRFDARADRAAAGVVRAKTGTLTGVSSLAGVATSGGRTIVFVVMADDVPPAAGTLAARAALDRVAAAVVGS